MDTGYIVGIEIGSSKIKIGVGYRDAERNLHVLAVEETNILDSVRYGVVCNVEMVANALGAMIRRLEDRLAPRHVESVYVAVGGLSTSTMEVEVDRQLPDEMEITSHLIDQLRNEAFATSIAGKDIIAMEPKMFYIDRKPTEHPEGMYGRNIRAEFNLITCRAQNQCNLKRVITDKLGLPVNGYVVRQLAEAELVLSSEEKRRGCMFVDFGAETTTVSIYRKGILRYMATIPLGSRNITKDLMTIHHLEEKAEEIKKIGGSAIPSNSADYASGGFDFSESNNYVAARAGEIIANIKAQLEFAGVRPADLPDGIIIVGNGAKLRDFNNRLENVTKLKVRQGFPSRSVHISDSRIQPSDAVDIIAILASASLERGVRDCMPMPPAPEPEPEPEPRPIVVEEEKPAPAAQPDPEPEPEQVHDSESDRRRGGFFSSLGSRIAAIMRGPDDDSDDFNDDED